MAAAGAAVAANKLKRVYDHVMNRKLQYGAAGVAGYIAGPRNKIPANNSALYVFFKR